MTDKLANYNVTYSLWFIVNKSSSLRPVDIKIKIGLRIKAFREKAQMSQKDLAFEADLDRSYIASIENGQRNVSAVSIEKIATALGVTVKEFFNDADFNKYPKGSK